MPGLTATRGGLALATVLGLCLVSAGACNLDDPLATAESDGSSLTEDDAPPAPSDTDAPTTDTTDTSSPEAETSRSDAAEDARTSSDAPRSNAPDALDSSDGDADACSPTDETCNGTDDDCDGATDEYCPCDYEGESRGVCENSERDSTGACIEPDDHVADTDDESPKCDRLDNDCDGAIDEGCSCDFQGKNAGICGDLTRNAQGACPEPAEFESTETSCFDGIDNDCDGVTDAADADCANRAGDSCSSNGDCRGACRQGTCTHRVFVTSETFRGNLGGLSGADQTCNDLASRAGRQGDWAAILSTSSTSAKSRLDIRDAVVRVDETLVASDRAEFWSAVHQVEMNRDEDGNKVTDQVWTGTNEDGTSDGTGESDGDGEYCGDWSTNGPVFNGEAGHSNKRDLDDGQSWVESSSNSDPTCDTPLRLYCIDGQ